MDRNHAMLMEKVGDGILQAALAEEQMLDQKLKAMENLDEDDFEILRQRRRMAIQKKMEQEQNWKQLGHGRYCFTVFLLFILFIHSSLDI